jgi:hypothetical protein
MIFDFVRSFFSKLLKEQVSPVNKHVLSAQILLLYDSCCIDIGDIGESVDLRKIVNNYNPN